MYRVNEPEVTIARAHNKLTYTLPVCYAIFFAAALFFPELLNSLDLRSRFAALGHQFAHLSFALVLCFPH
jgi:hypothetical protein